MITQNDYFRANKDLWNQRTCVHKESAFYNLSGFKKGATVLTPIELSEIGHPEGKRMLHLQCHFGMDSLDWARRDVDVTGVDFSEAAIDEARKLSEELQLNAKFICCNIYDLKNNLDDRFDIVFTSYGVLGWLPDLDRWAEIVSHFLVPGGVFYMAEFHPVVWMFDEEFTHVKYYYHNREVIISENEGTYTDRNARINGKEYCWNHSISEVLNALLKAGLRIEFFNEHMYAPYPCFRNLVETENGKWHIKGMEGKLPLVYSVRTVKQ